MCAPRIQPPYNNFVRSINCVCLCKFHFGSKINITQLVYLVDWLAGWQAN